MNRNEVRQMWIKPIFAFFMMCFLLGCGVEKTPMQIQSSASNPGGKKVILIMVDSLLKEPLETLMKENKVPAFSFLKENGWYTDKMISSFPTMSVNIDSTLLTGTYADKHRVPGLRWYDVHSQRMINYGDGPLPILKTGVNHVLTDSLFRLNNEHLSKSEQTIHEDLAKKGYSSSSINALVYRGTTEQTLHIPGPFQNIKTMAPPYFVLGTFHHYLTTNLKEQYLNYYGINDHLSIQHLKQLLHSQTLPHFTQVYLPDLDHETHKHGRNLAESVLKVDRRLQEIFNSYRSWNEAIQQNVFIVMGDSGVSKMKEEREEALIHLDHYFNAMKMAKPGEKPGPAVELALAVNERMAYVYPLQDRIQENELAEKLTSDSRMDTISWKNGDWIEVVQGGSQKRLRFRPGSSYVDPYFQRWDIEGDVGVLDLQMGQQRDRIMYGQYPDGLRHLYSAAHSHSGRFITVTAKPGYELKSGDSPTHVGGGAHGSFHEIDTYFPLFIAGTEKKPKTSRIVDFKSFILDVIGGE